MNAKLLVKAASIIFENPKWRRKLKTIAAIGIVGLFLSGGLVIWAGWSATKYLMQEIGPAVATGVNALDSAEAAITQGQVPAVGLIASVEKCWSKVQIVAESENLIVGGVTGGATGGVYAALISMKDACLGAVRSELPKNNGESGEVI
jgi:hypothetical protein